MLGDKKTLPFWRYRKPNFFELERTLASEDSRRSERQTDSEHAVIERKLGQYRFEVSQGRIHPPT